MRIIAGKKRGTKLIPPRTYSSRPITDRVKESLFSVIYKYDLPNGKRVADLFAGVGSLGLEALSRGARFVTFVEQDPEIIRTLNKNIEKTNFIAESKVIKANAFKVGAPVGFNEEKYGLIFVDPSYAMSRDVTAGSKLACLLDILPNQLDPNGIVIVRTDDHTHLLTEYGPLESIDRRTWGTMSITILQLSNG